MEAKQIALTEETLRRIDALESRLRPWEYAHEYQKARDLYDRVGDRLRADQLHWELEAWRMIPHRAWEEGIPARPFKPTLSSADGRGWPEFVAWPDEQLDHLNARADATSNPAIRARYKDLVWARRNDHRLARAAFEAYLEVVANAGDAPVTIDLLHAATRPLLIAAQLNDQTLLGRAKHALLSRLYFHVRRAEYRWVQELGGTVVQRSRHFTQAEIEYAADTVERAADYYASEPEDEFLERDALLLAIKLRVKSRAPEGVVATLKERIAQSNEREAGRQERDSPGLAAEANRRALAVYQQLGVDLYGPKIAELERRVQVQVGQSQESASRFEIPFQLNVGYVDRVLDDLLKERPPADLVDLSFVEGVIPNLTAVRREIESRREDDALEFLIPRQLIRNGNVVHEATTEAEIFEDLVAERFHQQVQVRALLLERVVDRLRAERVWTRGRLMRRFRQAPLVANRDLRLLDNALRRYFARDYLAAVPLLVLEVEPALRAILPLLGLPSARTDPRTGLAGEKNLDQLLAVPELQRLLGEDYIYFVRMVLTDQRGFLLRHGMAHGVLPADAYIAKAAHLLVYMLLWLTQFVPSVSGTGDAASLSA
jgi:Domain of unknown function (DUF4209)